MCQSNARSFTSGPNTRYPHTGPIQPTAFEPSQPPIQIGSSWAGHATANRHRTSACLSPPTLTFPMASTSLELVAGPSSGLAPSPAVSSSAMSSSTGSGPFLEGSPSSLFWRPDDSNEEPAPLEDIQREDECLRAAQAQHSPPQPSLLETLETRYPSGPRAQHDGEAYGRHVGLGIAAYGQSRGAYAAHEKDRATRDDVSVDALLADDALAAPERQWWPQGANKGSPLVPC